MTAYIAPIRNFVKLTRAEEVNCRFDVATSKFLTIKQRIDEYCTNFPSARGELRNAIKDFKKNNPGMTWLDHKENMPEAGACKLSDVVIDDTMNRPLVWNHALNIIRNFDAAIIQNLLVYRDPLTPGQYVAWDGQHTAVVLYIIMIDIYGISASNFVVPICISPITKKAKLREVFIVHAGPGKEKISDLAMWENMVRGARHEGSTNPEWKAADEKQKLIAAAGLFLTESARGDSDQPGAVTAVSHVISQSIKLIEYFTTYWKYRGAFENRSVETKELFLMLQFFDLYEKQNIKLSDSDIKDMVKIMWDTFECEFTTQTPQNKFFTKVNIAYLNWYKRQFFPTNCRAKFWENLTDRQKEKVAKPLDMLKKNGTRAQDPYYVAFIIHQLAKYKFQNLPKPSDEVASFIPAQADLW